MLASFIRPKLRLLSGLWVRRRSGEKCLPQGSSQTKAYTCYTVRSWHWKACKRKLAWRIAEQGYLKPSQKHPEDKTTVLRLYNSFQMLQPTVGPPHFPVREASPPVLWFLNCSSPVPAMTVALTIIGFFISIYQQCIICMNSKRGIMSLNLKTNEPFHHQKWCDAHILSSRGKLNGTVKLCVGMRWHHYLNASGGKTSADSGVQCHRNQ